MTEYNAPVRDMHLVIENELLGQDTAAVRTRAVRAGDHYRLFDQKIYITWGERDPAENIIHFVLARTPDAPPGVKGISLFLVPRRLAACRT